MIHQAVNCNLHRAVGWGEERTPTLMAFKLSMTLLLRCRWFSSGFMAVVLGFLSSTYALHGHIPLSKAMQVSVLEAEQESVVLIAPLVPNINYTDSVLGGSASAVATLAAWSLVHVRLKSAGIASSIVIQNNSMSYERPILGTFTARSFIMPPEAWDIFMRTLFRRGRARIAVSAILDYEGQPVGNFEGNFVAIVAKPYPLSAGKGIKETH